VGVRGWLTKECRSKEGRATACPIACQQLRSCCIISYPAHLPAPPPPPLNNNAHPYPPPDPTAPLRPRARSPPERRLRDAGAQGAAQGPAGGDDELRHLHVAGQERRARGGWRAVGGVQVGGGRWQGLTVQGLRVVFRWAQREGLTRWLVMSGGGGQVAVVGSGGGVWWWSWWSGVCCGGQLCAVCS